LALLRQLVSGTMSDCNRGRKWDPSDRLARALAGVGQYRFADDSGRVWRVFSHYANAAGQCLCGVHEAKENRQERKLVLTHDAVPVSPMQILLLKWGSLRRLTAR